MLSKMMGSKPPIFPPIISPGGTRDNLLAGGDRCRSNANATNLRKNTRYCLGAAGGATAGLGAAGAAGLGAAGAGEAAAGAPGAAAPPVALSYSSIISLVMSTVLDA